MGQEFSTMCSTSVSGKPGERTGKDVVKTKLERAAKTGVLQLASQKLKKLPKFDTDVKAAVHSLDLSHNPLPEDALSALALNQWSKLKTLKLQSMALEALPASLGSVATLKVFDASENKLTARAIDASFDTMTCESLVLHDNPLRTVPRCAFACSLKTLDLRRCALECLTLLATSSSPALVELLLDGNALREVPSELATVCPNLKRLTLQSNRLASLPAEVLKLSKLEHIDLKDNIITKTIFLALPGADEFMKRREATRKKEMGLSDYSVCGLD